MIDYTDPEVVARQNISPNAGCEIDGEFYDIRNCIHEMERMRIALRKIAAQDVDGIGGFEMFLSCVLVAKEALK